MKKTIADVLHRAADYWLAVDGDDWRRRFCSKEFSCSAVKASADELGMSLEEISNIFEGLFKMGCPTDSWCAFLEFGYKDEVNAEVQGARYMWLKLAALIAEEQGV